MGILCIFIIGMLFGAYNALLVKGWISSLAQHTQKHGEIKKDDEPKV